MQEKEIINEYKHGDINVIVHIPLNVNQDMKQQKINEIYDILKPKTNK